MANKTRWDWVVQLTHWMVATLFLVNYFITEEGSTIHQWVGYTAVGGVAIRLLWGCVAKPPARLSSFQPSIPSAIQHLEEVYLTRKDNHQGHNPAGAIMIWCIWSGLLVAGVSGYMMQTDLFWGEDWVEVIHEIAVNTIFFCVCIHIVAVVVMSRVTGHSYLKNMLPRKLKK